MEVKDLMTPDAVLDIGETDKRGMLTQMARRAASLTGEDAERILAALTAREDLGSTALGNGIAIPHARLARLKTPVGVFARVSSPIDFDAIDDRDVDLVFLLLLPEQSPESQLKPMACAARKLRDPALAKQLRQARGAEELYALLTTSGEARQG